ncbi:MAG TPA: hypothetical protein VHF89_09570 [Solirubrobacteraceae bacterium]|nr:hypothetical protein [Solirubrobacteraceae bacterium]
MRAWIALVDGSLRVWTQRAKPVREALRMDARLVDPAGDAATCSLVLAPREARLLFDDTAVQQARRDVLARLPFDGVTTLLRDSSHFAGSLVIARGEEQVARLRDDPFARLYPAVRVEVPAGVLGAAPPPAGPTIERYGSANPWPWDRFG